MDFKTPQVEEFRRKLMELPKSQLLDIIKDQNPKYLDQINRIEWVFQNKLSHIYDAQGNPITNRDFSKDELINLIDPPFIFSKDMMKQGFNEDAQRQIHIASDPVLWSRQILNAKPRAYQALVMRETNDQVVLRWGRRLGKALDVDTIIPGPDGDKPMGEIQVGDKVFDENGKVCNVVDATEYQLDRKCYKLTFSDGTEIVADAEHVWSVHDFADRMAISNGSVRALQNLTTAQLAESFLTWKGDRNYSIPLCGAVEFEKRDLPIHPYVYGYMICNGYEGDNTVRIIAKDHEAVVKKFKEFGYTARQLKGNKFIVEEVDPDQLTVFKIRSDYMTTCSEDRFSLLQGICDARVGHANDLMEISLPDEAFIRQISKLIAGLGFECRYTSKVNKKNGQYYGTNHKLFWSNDPDFFFLERKKRPVSEKKRRGKHRFISNIEEVETRPVKCIGVDSKSRLFLASDSYIPTHNSYFLSMYIIWYAFVHPKARVLIMAPTKAQVALIFEQILELADESPIVMNAIVKAPKSPHHEIVLSNKATMRFFTTGQSSGKKSDGARGQEADMIVLDEMDYMGAEDLVALMAMLQKTDENKFFSKKLIGASTPTGQRSTYWRWNTDPAEKFASFWFPSMVNPGWDQEEEEKARRRYKNEQHYRHEIEADWGEDADGVYPRKYVDVAFFQSKVGDYASFRPNPEKYMYVMGVDWDKHGAGVNIVICECPIGAKEGSEIRVVYREEIAKGENTYLEALDYIIKLNDLYQFEHIYIDQGAGEVQAEMLHKFGLENPHTGLQRKVKACHFSNTIEVRDPYTRQIAKKRLKPYMIDNLVYQLEQTTVKFYSDDDELYLQLISYIKMRETDTGYPVYAPGGETTDHAHDALILALFAVQENYDDFFSLGLPQAPKAISNSFFMPGDSKPQQREVPQDDKQTGDKPKVETALTSAKAKHVPVRKKSGSSNRIKRKMF